MKKNLLQVAALAALGALALPAAAVDTVVFDQGPGAATYNRDWVTSWAGAQTETDKVVFAQDTVVRGYTYFTPINMASRAGADKFTFSIYADASNPADGKMYQKAGALLFSTDLGFSSISPKSGALYAVNFSLPAYTFQANTTYWVGIAGKGFSAEVALANDFFTPGLTAPQDGLVGQFVFGASQGVMPIGDLMFQMTGSAAPVPEPETYALLLAGLGMVGVMARRRAGRAA